MKTKIFIHALFVLLSMNFSILQAQVSIGNATPPRAGALLDLQSTTKGLLLPKVALADVSIFSLEGTDSPEAARGMLVFNTNAAIVGGNGAGLYVWSGTKWYTTTITLPALNISTENVESGKVVFKITRPEGWDDADWDDFLTAEAVSSSPLGSLTKSDDDYLYTVITTTANQSVQVTIKGEVNGKIIPETNSETVVVPINLPEVTFSVSDTWGDEVIFTITRPEGWDDADWDGLENSGIVTSTRPGTLTKESGTTYTYTVKATEANQKVQITVGGTINGKTIMPASSPEVTIPYYLPLPTISSRIFCGNVFFTITRPDTGWTDAEWDAIETTPGVVDCTLTGKLTKKGNTTYMYIAPAIIDRQTAQLTVSGTINNRQVVPARLISDEIPFEIVTDYDGNTYKTKLFGEQCWMTQNLRTTKTADGVQLELLRMNSGKLGTSNTSVVITGPVGNNTTGSYSVTENGRVETYNVSTWTAKYGLHYLQTQALLACPSGWKLPDNDDWDALAKFLGGIEVAGKKMKSDNYIYKASDTTTGHNWDGYPIGHSDNSGFNALPAGYINGHPALEESGGFSNRGYWWSVNFNVNWQVERDQILLKKNDSAHNSSLPYLYSIRCIKD